MWVYHWRQGGDTATCSAVTGPQQTLQEVTSLVTEHDAICAVCSVLWPEELGAVRTLCDYSQSLHHGNGNVSCIVVGGWYFLTELDTTEICAYCNVQKEGCLYLV